MLSKFAINYVANLPKPDANDSKCHNNVNYLISVLVRHDKRILEYRNIFGSKYNLTIRVLMVLHITPELVATEIHEINSASLTAIKPVLETLQSLSYITTGIRYLRVQFAGKNRMRKLTTYSLTESGKQFIRKHFEDIS